MAIAKKWSTRRAVFMSAAALTLSVACADAPYERINAYDGRFSTPGRIVGLPDTITAVGDSVQLTVEAGAQYSDVQRRWFVRRIDLESCPFGCGLLQVGEFTGLLKAEPTSYPRRWEVRVLMGVQLYVDTVVTRQVPTNFRLLCRGDTVCGTSDYDTPIDYPLTRVSLLDANGVPLLYQPDSARVAGASYTVRDRRIVDTVSDTLRSRFTDGNTWIVRQQFGKIDSLQWAVRQQLGSVELTCPSSAALSDTVSLVAVAKDPRGAPMNTPVRWSWSLFFGFVWGTFLRPITSDGRFVPTEPGTFIVVVNAQHPVEQPTIGHGADCEVRVR